MMSHQTDAFHWSDIVAIREKAYNNCITPLNHVAATLAVNGLYETAGFKPPEIIFADSPLSCLKLAEQEDYHNTLENISLDIWEHFGRLLRGPLWSSLSRTCTNETLMALRNYLWYPLKDHLWGSLSRLLWAHLPTQYSSIFERATSLYWEQCHLVWFEGICVAGTSDTPELWQRFHQIVNNLDFIVTYPNLCIVSKRPKHIHWHDNGMLHGERGPAVSYRDGFHLWALEGVKVPPSLVLFPHHETLDSIHQEENPILRRLRLQRYGYSQYFNDMGAKVIDLSFPSYGAMEALLKCNHQMVLFTYDPSTSKPYALEVANSCRTCQDAQRFLLSPEFAFSPFNLEIKDISTYPRIRT